MKINYKKKNSRFNLIIGIIWFVYFWICVLAFEDTSWRDYGWLVISIVYIGNYFYQRKYQYAEITDEFIRTLDPIFGKKLELKEVNTVRKFAGDYIFKTDKKELTINTQVITEESLEQLNHKVDELGIQWT